MSVIGPHLLLTKQVGLYFELAGLLDAASDTFTSGTLADKPPQGNDAKCGFACHTKVKTRDYVFTDYGHR